MARLLRSTVVCSTAWPEDNVGDKSAALNDIPGCFHEPVMRANQSYKDTEQIHSIKSQKAS